MTRVRYTDLGAGQRESKNMLAGNSMVFVLDNNVDHTFQIINSDTNAVVIAGKHKNGNVRMKMVKAALTSLGVLFQQEVRTRKAPTLETTSTEVA